MIVRTYPLKQVTTRCAHCGETNERQVQKGVDVGIVTQLFKLEKRMDRLILCAGDGDFADAVETLSSMGKDIVLAAFRDTCSPDLQCFANRLIWAGRGLGKHPQGAPRGLRLRPDLPRRGANAMKRQGGLRR